MKLIHRRTQKQQSQSHSRYPNHWIFNSFLHLIESHLPVKTLAAATARYNVILYCHLLGHQHCWMGWMAHQNWPSHRSCFLLHEKPETRRNPQTSDDNNNEPKRQTPTTNTMVNLKMHSIINFTPSRPSAPCNLQLHRKQQIILQLVSVASSLSVHWHISQ